MLNKIISLLKRPTNKDIMVNTLGNYIGVFFTALFALILVRILDPSQYGVLSVLLGIAYVLSNVLDFGTTATIYSSVPVLINKQSKELFRFVKSIFIFQSLFSLIVIIILLVSFPYLDKVFFKTRAPIWELYITCASVLFFIWQNFLSNILLAAKKFLKVNLYINISNVLKTLVIFIMMSTRTVGVGSIIFVFGVVGPLIFFLLIFLEKKNSILELLRSEIDKEEFKFRYTFTYFLASQFFNLGLRMDLFLLSYFRPKEEVGYYGLSQKIILTVTTTIISITQVLSPRFSQIHLKNDVKRLFKIAIAYMMIPTGLFIILFILPHQIFDIFFTNKFSKTADITKALSMPFILYALGSIPMLFLLYTVKKPKYILISNIIFFAIITLGSYYLIPIKGVFGPPTAIFFALLTAILFQVLALIKEYRALPK